MQVQHYDCIIRCCAFLYRQFYLEIKRNPHGVWVEIWSAGQLRPQEGRGGGGYSTIFFILRSNLLPFRILFLTEKVSLRIPFIDK